MRALLLVLVASFALLGFRPGAAPVGFDAAALFPGMEICHDGPVPEPRDADKSCVFCHLIAGALADLSAPAQGAMRPVRFTRLNRPRGTGLPRPRSLRIARARAPPVSGSVIA
ncbi:hypothetical protein SAMN05878503_10529 [Cereibacter ovatus]|uniref:DUF2946 domain-containing protein n=1 Tax=Cereibacter ovatus TaxID=439529 RepID=A0A285CRG1_9RHOB|nr:hypothetical protein [Cereibacter ovatus]SNX70121.1 hypothetical protein SAMN05878503_10529 [Cereibacter ovatus]